MDTQVLIQQAKDLAAQSQTLAERAAELANQTQLLGAGLPTSPTSFMVLATLFLLSCLLGGQLALRIAETRPALLSGLAAVLSSIVALAAVTGAGLGGMPQAKILGVIALALASEAVFGGLFAMQRLAGETPADEVPDASVKRDGEVSS